MQSLKKGWYPCCRSEWEVYSKSACCHPWVLYTGDGIVSWTQSWHKGPDMFKPKGWQGEQMVAQNTFLTNMSENHHTWTCHHHSGCLIWCNPIKVRSCWWAGLVCCTILASWNQSQTHGTRVLPWAQVSGLLGTSLVDSVYGIQGQKFPRGATRARALVGPGLGWEPPEPHCQPQPSPRHWRGTPNFRDS